MVTSPGVSSGTFVLGPVTADARRVSINGSAGEVEAKVATAPEALHSDVRFYVAQLPAGMADAPMTVEAFDGQGDVIASSSIAPTRSRSR
jgi:hypothetical protein